MTEWQHQQEVFPPLVRNFQPPAPAEKPLPYTSLTFSKLSAYNIHGRREVRKDTVQLKELNEIGIHPSKRALNCLS